jgi:hypothetical protein
MPKTIKKCQKVQKWHFGGSPTVQKPADSRKTGKNREKVNQKPIKKWSKSGQKGSKVCRKKCHFGGQKSMVLGAWEGPKVPFFVMGGVKNVKNWQILTNPDKSWKPCQKCTANWHGKIESQVFIRFWQFWQNPKSKSAENHEKWSKVSKTAFFRVVRVGKITNSRKTGKNCQKVTQKLIKKWPKKHQKGPKVCRKNAILGVKKHTSGYPKVPKSALFGHQEGQKWQNPKNPKTDSKKYSQKAQI